jgi:hypothetical protein
MLTHTYNSLYLLLELLLALWPLQQQQQQQGLGMQVVGLGR